jgi:hypothetical protein
MKNSLLLFLCAIPCWVAAQNLTYSQTHFITSASGTVTCPAGTVWKVEQVVFSSTLPDAACNSGTTSCSGSRHDDNISVNGTTVRARSMSSRAKDGTGGHASVMLWQHPMPIWLVAGNTIATGTGVLGISVIEFTEAP